MIVRSKEQLRWQGVKQQNTDFVINHHQEIQTLVKIQSDKMLQNDEMIAVYLSLWGSKKRKFFTEKKGSFMFWHGKREKSSILCFHTCCPYNQTTQTGGTAACLMRASRVKSWCSGTMPDLWYGWKADSSGINIQAGCQYSQKHGTRRSATVRH